MSLQLSNLDAWSVAWLNVVAAAVVQSTVLAVVIALVARVLRNSGPTVRYWLWQIVPLRLLIVPFWTVSLTVPWLTAEPPIARVQPTHTQEAAEPVKGAPLETDAALDAVPAAPTTTESMAKKSGALLRFNWQTWLMLGWAAIVIAQLGRLAVERRRLHRLLSVTTPAPASLVESCRQVAARLGCSRVPEVRISPHEGSPFVCGVWRSKLVVPQTLVTALEPVELSAVMAHELAHLKRRDLLWGWLVELARVLYFFHPVIYWAGYHLRLERELACDQLALAHGGQSTGDYATTLVRVLSAASEPNIFRTTIAAGLSGVEPAEQ